MRLYVSDLDGTLLNNDACLSEETLRLLRPLIANDFPFTFATGRSLLQTHRFIKALGIRLPVILENGVYIYDPLSEKYLVKNFLEWTDLQYFLKVFDERNLHPFINTENADGEEKIYFKPPTHDRMRKIISVELDTQAASRQQLTSYEQLAGKYFISISITDKEEVLRPIYESLVKEYPVESYFSKDHYVPGFYWLEIYSPEISKGKGVQYLKEKLSAKELICFGDAPNDISMLEAADRAYVMEHAIEAVKRSATAIIGSNQENVVAKFVALEAKQS